MATDNKISTLVESQVPGYLLEEGPNLVAFLKAYYEWMETTGQVTDVSKNLLANRDIDTTDLNKFYEYFRREVLADFPKEVLADRRLVAKRIKDLYRAKGSAAAYNLLFRILYNQDVSIYKPSENILRASDGRWIEQTLLRLGAPFVGNPEDMEGRIVTGQSSGAIGTVIRVLTVFESGIEVKQLRLKDVTGIFQDLEIVQTGSGLSGQVVNTVGPLVSVLIGGEGTTGGTGHQVGDSVSFTGQRGSGGTGTVIATNDEAVTFSITDGGSGYSVNTTSVSIFGGNPTLGIIGKINVTAISNTETIPVFIDTIQGLSNTSIGFGPTYSSNSGVISSNLASSNSSTALSAALGIEDRIVGSISGIDVIPGNYRAFLPDVAAIDSIISPLEIPDNVRGGIKGRNAVITPSFTPGSITQVDVDTGGTLYSSTLPVTIVNTTRSEANNAIGDPVVTGVITQAGNYKGTKGFLSWDQRLQDNYYYQEFSYVLKSQKALKTYRNIVKDVIHPAGTKLFGQIDVSIEADLTGMGVESLVYTDLIGGKFGIPSRVSNVVFGSISDIQRDMNIPSVTSTFVSSGHTIEISVNPSSIVAGQTFSTDAIVDLDVLPTSISGSTTFSTDSLLSHVMFASPLTSTLAIPKGNVYLPANGFVYTTNDNVITPYLVRPISDYLDQPVVIGTPFVVQGDGGIMFSTIVKGGSRIEIEDRIPGTSGNTTYIVNTVFSNTTFTINPQFVGGAMANGIFRYTYNGNI